MKRHDGRQEKEMRQIHIIPGYIEHPDGSVLVSFGKTKVICNASVENKVPPFLKDSGEGWVTAEYGMLPASTHERMNREAARGKQGGRTLEIQRLIGRSLRAVVNRRKLGERSIVVDCDVIQADGGTRTAAITGAYVAMVIAVRKMLERGDIEKNPLKGQVAAVSLGLHQGKVLLDLDYSEDSSADVDMNIVGTDAGTIIEIQGTAEGDPFSYNDMEKIVKMGLKGIKELCTLQKNVLDSLS